MILSLIAIVAGLALLVWSADHFVEGATSIAKHLGASTLIIGITIIGFGTSAPEILVSVIAVLEDTPDIAIGNALGSNIANIGLILGVTAFVTPVPIVSELIRRELPLLLLATVIMAWCLVDGTVDLFDAALLLGTLIIMLWYLVKSHRQSPDFDAEEKKLEKSLPAEMSLSKALIWSVFGLAVLVGSSKLLIWGATNVAVALGVSELIIGLTIIALGTSLPELAASLSSLKKGVPDMAIGNVIGSNLFNSLAVIGIPATFKSFEFHASAITRDLPVVAGFTLLLFCFAMYPRTAARSITRVKGLWLLCGFVIYELYLYYEVTTGIT